MKPEIRDVFQMIVHADQMTDSPWELARDIAARALESERSIDGPADRNLQAEMLRTAIAETEGLNRRTRIRLEGYLDAALALERERHEIINGHHVSWCPCGDQEREHESGPWDAWGSEDPWHE